MMPAMRSALVLVMILSSSPCLFAVRADTRAFLSADSPTRVPVSLVLSDVFRLALQKNERIRISEEDVVAAKENIRLARSTVLPDFATTISQSRNKEAGTGGFTTFKNNREFRLELEQALYGGGKEWAAYRGAKIEKEISELQVRIVRQAILFEASVEFYSLLSAQKKLVIARRSLGLAGDQLALAKARKAAGSATRTEVIRSEVVVSSAESHLVRAEKDVAVFRARLGFVCARTLPATFWAVDADTFADIEPDTAPTPADVLVEQALNTRPDFRISALTLKVAEEGIAVARAGFSPTAKLSGNFTKTENVSAFRDPENWQVVARVDYDIFDGFGRDAQYEKSKSGLRRAALDQMYLSRQIELEVRESVLEMDALRAIREASRKEASSAEENHRRVLAQFKEGLSTAVDVADAHTALIAAQVQTATTESDIKLAAKKMELSLGILGMDVLNSTTPMEARK